MEHSRDDSTNHTIDLDHADEDILTYDVSDEALEAAADKDAPGGGYSGFFSFSQRCC